MENADEWRREKRNAWKFLLQDSKYSMFHVKRSQMNDAIDIQLRKHISMEIVA